MMATIWNIVKPLEVEYRQPILQSSDQGNSSRKRDRYATLWQRDRGLRVEVKDGSPMKRLAFDSTLTRKKSIRRRIADMRAMFQSGMNALQIALLQKEDYITLHYYKGQ